MESVVYEFVHTLILCSRNGNNRDTEFRFEFVDANGSTVLFDLVHHVQRKHHGNAQFHNLHGEVHIAFNVGAVDDVDNAIWLRFEKEVARYDFFI